MMELEGRSCLRHNQSTFTHPLQYLDCKGHSTYPVASPKNQVRILIVPHCEYENAQCLMAAAYQGVQGQTFDTVILVSQARDISFHGVALPCLIDNNSYFKDVLVCVAAVEKLSQHQLFYYYQSPFCDNQNLQLQCTLLNFYMKDVAIIPLIVGQLSRDEALQVAVMLANCSSSQALIVFSADIAAYKNVMNDNPLDQSEICKVYDNDACKIQAIQSGALRQRVDLFEDAYSSATFAVLFELLQLSHFKDLETCLVGYTTSGFDDSQDASHQDLHRFEYIEPVKTCAAFMLQDSPSGYKNQIGAYERLQLLQCARQGLDSLFGTCAYRKPCMISYEMARPHGAFASLYTMSDHGKLLRGCIGKVQSKLPLHEMVSEMAHQAASKDLRFYPLRQKEVDTTIISLSVIVDLKKIQQPDQIQYLDGVMLQYDDKEAVALPVTIPISDWNYESTLTSLSDQIGQSLLWQKPRAKISTFRSLIFQEE